MNMMTKIGNSRGMEEADDSRRRGSEMDLLRMIPTLQPATHFPSGVRVRLM